MSSHDGGPGVDPQGGDGSLSLVQPIGSRKRKKSRGTSPLIYVGAMVVAAGVVGAVVLGGSQLKTHRPTPVGVASLKAAESCLKDHDLPCAEEDFRAYLQKYPGDPHATALLAMTLSEDGQHDEALRYFKAASDEGVDTYDFDAAWARSLEAKGRLDEAIEKNYTTLRLVPQLVDVRGSLANELVRKGRSQEAVNLLQTFDQSLIDRGEPPYFTDQINRIKSKMGGAAAAEAASSTAAQQQTVVGKIEGETVDANGVSYIPLTPNHGTLQTTAIVDDSVPVDFAVDSGASDVSLPQDVIQRLLHEGKITRADYRGSGYAILANGMHVPTQAYNLHSLKVGNHVLHNVTATTAPYGSPPLLGQSFLRRFRSWSIDNRKRVLILQE